jgi:hypothetical protein
MWATGSRCNLSARIWRRDISISRMFNKILKGETRRRIPNC